MTSFLPAVPYPPPTTGFWGPVTSTLDWCEENYYLTHYIAEFVNSLTNATLVYLGFRGVRNCLVHGHDKVFLVAWAAYLMVGLGSFAFHATLRYTMQLVDEISMIYTSSVLVYALFSHGQSTARKWGVGVSVTALSLWVSFYYFYLNNPVFHQAAFTLLTLLVVLKGVYLMETTLRPKWRKVYAAVQGRPERWTNGHGAVIRAKDEYAEQVRRDQKDLELLRGMYTLILYGLFCALSGFVLWITDRQKCSTIRGWRQHVGLPWGFVLEGHGWWHILTGIGGYINVVWNIWMRYGLYGRQDEVELIWPSMVFSMPDVVKRRKPKVQ